MSEPVQLHPYHAAKVPVGLGFLVGLAFLVPVASRAGVTLGHVILVGLLPVTLAASWRLRATRFLLGAEVVWLVVAVITDHLQGVGLHVSYLTLTRPIIFLVTYCGFVWLYQMGRRHVLAASAGFVVGVIVASALYRVGNFEIDPWKYGLGDPVSLAIVIGAGWAMLHKHTALAIGLGTAALLANLLLGFRSELAVVLVAAAIAAIGGKVRTNNRRWIIKLGMSLLAVVVVGYPVYGFLASSGHLGAEQQYKWEGQSQVTGGAVIGARPEFVAASVIIGQSPILGQGTGFSVDLSTQARFLARLDQLGVSVSHEDSQFFFGKGVYLHSAFFQTWAESGILSLPGMLLPWFLVLRATGRAVRRGSRPLALIFGVVAAQFTWDFLFSPWLRLGPSLLGVAAAAAAVYLSTSGDPKAESIEPAEPRVLMLTP